jgi:ATP-dependent Clp protease adaptor protein ClpS
VAGPSKKHEEEGGVATEQETQKKLKRPRLYKVLLHNDDFTTMEFVVELLIHVFHHTESDAQGIMLLIHHHGVGVAGVFTYEVAETKVTQVMELAEQAEYPLLCTMEPEEPRDDEE